jgi:hypothetical protein
MIPLTAWDRLRAGIERFCAGRVEVEEEGDRLTCRQGVATFSVSRAGEIEAGMPLHGFETAGVEALGIDVEKGELLVETDETRYVFRHP